MSLSKFFTGVLVLLVLVPVGASAFSVEDIQTQINALLARVQVLTQQLQTLQSTGSVGITPPTGAAPGLCVRLYRNLGSGSQGDDVYQLQEFLRQQGAFSGAATGYFGPLTTAALQTWQSAQGIASHGDPYATGWGYAGPQTRVRIEKLCGTGAPPEKGEFTARPNTGDAPLTVSFSANVILTDPSHIADAGSYKIVFGDGAETVFDCTSDGPSGVCYGPHTASHTYTAAGTYTAQLVHFGFYGPRDESVNSTVKGVATITVGGGGTTEPPTQCQQWHDGCNDCSRSYPGGPLACTKRACFAAGPAYCKAYFDSNTTNQAPVVSGISGPTGIRVGEAGTWTIDARDPEGQSLRYNLTWGDEYFFDRIASWALPQSFIQTSTFTHTYATAGTYTIAAQVTDAAGLSSTATITVQVAAPTACPLYAEVQCSPGYSAASGGYGANGCPLPSTCVPIQTGVCTADAMQCTDGSWVGRTGPNCEFICPSVHIYETGGSQVDCPAYQAPRCEEGYVVVSQGYGANGCLLPAVCQKK